VDVTLVEQIRPELTYRLRQQVLRPGMPPEDSFFPRDKDTSSGHFAAYLEDKIVGVASIFVEPETGGPGIWRLRGMAVDPEQQGSGQGAALIYRVRDFVHRSGGGLIWCNARLSAEGFYSKLGYVRAGEPRDEPGIGEHVRMHDTKSPVPVN
jgi:GNAT superfamily N-acetyltransferase